MNNFRFIANLDILPVMPRLHALRPATWKPREARGELNNEIIGLGASICLRGHDHETMENWLGDLPIKEQPALSGSGPKPYDKPWESMKRLLAQAKKAILDEQERMIESGALRRVYLSGQMGRANIIRLDPGSSIFWHVDNGPYHEKHKRFHLSLVTNPGCLLYSQSESLHVEAGLLCWFNNRVRHCAANWGVIPRLHLVFEMRVQETASDE